MDNQSTTSTPPKPECNHKGKWQGLGTSIISVNQLIILIHNLFCSECGETKIVSTKVPFPEETNKPKIAVPVIIPRN